MGAHVLVAGPAISHNSLTVRETIPDVPYLISQQVIPHAQDLSDALRSRLGYVTRRPRSHNGNSILLSRVPWRRIGGGVLHVPKEEPYSKGWPGLVRKALVAEGVVSLTPAGFTLARPLSVLAAPRSRRSNRSDLVLPSGSIHQAA